MENTLRKIYD